MREDKICINQDKPERMEKARKDVMGSNDKRELRQGPRPSITINIWNLLSDTLFENRGTEMLSKWTQIVKVKSIHKGRRKQWADEEKGETVFRIDELSVVE